MIKDNIAKCATYYPIHPYFPQAFEYIRSISQANFSVQRTELPGAELYAMQQQYLTKPRQQGVWEAHRKYIDIQYILEGEELINFAWLNDLKLGEYLEHSDHQKADGEGSPLFLKAGEFAVFFPQDVHMPGLAVNKSVEVKKIVCKLAVK